VIGLCAEGLAKPPRAARTRSPSREFVQAGSKKVRVIHTQARIPAAVAYKTEAAPARRLGTFDVTLAAGLNAGWGMAQPAQSGSTRNAMAFSLMFERRLNDTFSICPELSFAQRGVTKNLFPTYGVTGDVQLNNLEIPMLMKARLWLNSPRWRMFFVLGPSVALTLQRRVDVLGLVNLDLSNRFNQVDFHAIFGTGVEYQISPEIAAVVHLRYTLGLVDIDSTATTFQTRGIQLLFGAKFGL